MVDVVQFPSVLRLTDRADPFLIANTISGGEGMDGSEQVVSALSFRWRWRVSFPVKSAVEVRQLRALRTKLKGRFNYLRMRVCDMYRLTADAIGASYPDDGVPHDDDAPFDDDYGYAASPVHSPVTADAAAGDTTLRVRASDFAGEMAAGLFFSVGEWLHQTEDFELDGTDYVLTIAPPLREDVFAGSIANFDAVALWAFASDDEGGADLRLGKTGVVKLDLIEPVGRRLDDAA